MAVRRLHNGRLGSLRDRRDERRRADRRRRHLEQRARWIARSQAWVEALPPRERDHLRRIARLYRVPEYLLVATDG